MNLINLHDLANAVLGLERLESDMEREREEAGGDAVLKSKAFKDEISFLESVKATCHKSQFWNAYHVIVRSVESLHKDKTVARFCAEARHIAAEIEGELNRFTFLTVKQDRKAFVDNDQLFGIQVRERFPSAALDIKEAGSCLAAECNTAAVFHLMGAAEIGLRALAWDRRVALPKKTPVELGTWEDIIRELERAEYAIQGYKKTHAREAQYEFYHGAILEYRRFKNFWRNRLMHTREEYDRDQAHSALVHVREFMTILASKISEKTRTPLVWKKP